MKWSEQYNIYRCRLPIGELIVAWNTGGYYVSAFDKRLKDPSPDVDHAKARAVALARKLIAETEAML